MAFGMHRGGFRAYYVYNTEFGTYETVTFSNVFSGEVLRVRTPSACCSCSVMKPGHTSTCRGPLGSLRLSVDIQSHHGYLSQERSSPCFAFLSATIFEAMLPVSHLS